MMAAQTKAKAAQTLPPLTPFQLRGKLVGGDSFDRWVEHFEEHATVAGWSGEERKYRLKCTLIKLPSILFACYLKRIKRVTGRIKGGGGGGGGGFGGSEPPLSL